MASSTSHNTPTRKRAHHSFTFTHTSPQGGPARGRRTHGELEAHGGCGERYGRRVRENDGRRDSRAMVSKQGRSGGSARGHTGWSHGWSARVRAYQELARRGRRWGAPVVSVTSRIGCPGSPRCLFTGKEQYAVVGRGERSTPGLLLFLRLLSRSRVSWHRAGVSLALGGWL